MGSEGGKLQAKSERLYLSLVGLLKIAFAMDDNRLGGLSLRKAIALMFKMNAVNFQLAEEEMTPVFSIPEWLEGDPPVDSPKAAHALLDKLRKQLEEAELIKSPELMAQMRATSLPKSGMLPNHISPQVLKGEHQESIEEVFDFFEEAIDKTSYGH